MCGIAGYIGKNAPSDSLIDRTLALMKNRGPDHQACAAFNAGEIDVRLLHSRLSIIDLDARSNQPFTIDQSAIVYNGELYNYLELRKELVSDGIQLRTESDTEVLLHYYLRHGTNCVDHFEGMWAFAIYDLRDKSLFLSRDRFAEKPLYYIAKPDGFYFGSETNFLKSLISEKIPVNQRHLIRHMAHGYKALYKTNETYFEGVSELKYGENMIVDQSLSPKTNRYWKPTHSIDKTMSLRDAIEGTRERLLESVRIRLRADVPLAFCLSGGVDSAALVSIAAKEFNAKLTTYSIIDTDERYNEEDNIMATVNDIGCEHFSIQIPQEDAIARLKFLIEYHDAPVATLSSYVYSLITESVSQGGFRVSFSGNSADELFTGYYDHFNLHLNEVRDRADYESYLAGWREHAGKYVRNPFLKNPNLYHKNPNFREHVFDGMEEIREYLVEPFDEPYTEIEYSGSLLRSRMMNELFHEATPLILHEDDLNSMLYSIENRSPYLDSRLFEFAYSIPPEHLILDGYGKYILRQAVSGILNDKVRLDRRKKGFNASINSLIDLQNKEVRDYLLEPSSRVFELVRRDRIEKLLNQFPIPNHLSKFIFNFINAKIFLELN